MSTPIHSLNNATAIGYAAMPTASSRLNIGTSTKNDPARGFDTWQNLSDLGKLPIGSTTIWRINCGRRCAAISQVATRDLLQGRKRRPQGAQLPRAGPAVSISRRRHGEKSKRVGGHWMFN